MILIFMSLIQMDMSFGIRLKAVYVKGCWIVMTQKMVGLKMNVPDSCLEKIVSLLPSLNAPTVSSLYQSNWFSVETVVNSNTVRDLIPELLKHGAEGIIEYSLNKVI